MSKNALFDKTGTLEGAFSTLLGKSFLFSKADEIWKAKRKACAHAFYKERLVHMLEVLKEKVSDGCEKWTAQIAQSPDKNTVVDIAKVFFTIFARNIITISFGEDIYD